MGTWARVQSCWLEVNWQLILIKTITTAAISLFIADVAILTDEDRGKFLEEYVLGAGVEMKEGESKRWV